MFLFWLEANRRLPWILQSGKEVSLPQPTSRLLPPEVNNLKLVQGEVWLFYGVIISLWNNNINYTVAMTQEVGGNQLIEQTCLNE